MSPSTAPHCGNLGRQKSVRQEAKCTKLYHNLHKALRREPLLGAQKWIEVTNLADEELKKKKQKRN